MTNAFTESIVPSGRIPQLTLVPPVQLLLTPVGVENECSKVQRPAVCNTTHYVTISTAIGTLYDNGNFAAQKDGQIDTTVTYDKTLHDAADDAIASARLARKLLGAWPQIAGWKLKTLHDHQVEWRREQANSLRAYFDKAGIEHDGVDPGWPIQTTVPVAATQAGAA